MSINEETGFRISVQIHLIIKMNKAKLQTNSTTLHLHEAKTVRTFTFKSADFAVRIFTEKSLTAKRGRGAMQKKDSCQEPMRELGRP